MRKLYLHLFLCLLTNQFSNQQLFRNFAIIVDEKIENCAPLGQDAKVFDMSNLEIIAVSDYEAYINGSVKFLKKVDGKIPFNIYNEKFDRGQWHISVFNARRSSFCKAWHDPKEIWYTKMKRLKGCSLQIGVNKATKTHENFFKLQISRMNGSGTWSQCSTTPFNLALI